MSSLHHAGGSIIAIAETTHISLLEGMDLDSLKRLRQETNRKIKNEKTRLKFKANIEIPAEYREHFERAAEWAFNRKLIKTRSRWAFCKFAITNSIDFIIGQIEKEEMEKARAAAAISSQMVPGAQTQPGHAPEPPKTA